MTTRPAPRLRTRLLHAALLALLGLVPALAQTPANTSQQLVFAGLNTVAHTGSATAVATNSAGDLFLLLDDGDGIRLQKTTTANTVTQAHLGAAGDHGLALALDPIGNVYLTGTTTSTALTGTSGAAIPARTDSSTNSFVAKYDADLNLLFVTFTGGSRIATAAIAVSADSIFVTGQLYAANLPVTPGGVQQSPAANTTGNGFVERFNSTGTTLIYATYLTGAGGSTQPTAIAVDAADDAFVAGQTTSSGYPTVAALVPAILSNPSGFLTRLTPAGDGISASTFIPGPGLTSLALDSTGQTLLATGSVALGQFPVDTVQMPLVPSTYQVLLRLPLSLASVSSGTLIAPGPQSFVAAGPNGTAWVDGPLALPPLLPIPPLSTIGSAFAAQVTSTGSASQVTQTARLGGVAVESLTYASLPLTLNAVAVDPAGNALLAGQILPTASGTLLATETYDLPLRESPSLTLPSTVRQSETTASACSGSLCSGSAAYLARLSPNPAAALAFSTDDAPFLILRNLGSSTASGLALTLSAGAFTTTCPQTLAPGAECALLLTGGAAGSVTASYSSGTATATETAAFPAYTAPASPIVFLPKELDFGVVITSATRTVTVANLGAATQTFTSAADLPQTSTNGSPQKITTPFSEAASDCATSGTLQTKVLPAGAVCHITLAFSASAAASSNTLTTGLWTIAARDVLLTAISEPAALSPSATEIDFGTQYTGGLRLPRFLYISNLSTTTAQPHATVTQPAGSPFTLTDSCPPTLLPSTVCQIRIDYLSTRTPSNDTTTLTLDDGISVLITGNTLPQPGVTGATVNPSLSVTPTSVTFASPVVVTAISGDTQTVSIMNSGAAPFSLVLTLTGDFTQITSCGATLAAGATCAAVISFVPSQPGTRKGLLAIAAGNGFAPLYVPLSGTATAILPASNGEISLGTTIVGQPVIQFLPLAQPFSSLTVTITGTFTAALVENTGFGFATPSPSVFSSSLKGACRNCALAIRLLPITAGAQAGTLTIASAPGGTPYMLALTGLATPATGLLLTPGQVTFGDTPVHSSSAPILFTLTNLLPAAASATLASPTLTGDYTLSSAPTGSSACNGSLLSGASCVIAVAFAPTATGTRSGTLTLTTSAGNVSAPLTGDGTEDPGIALNPTALNFNDVPGPSATTQTVTVTNTSSAAAQLGAIASSSANFTATSTCATLAPGVSCTIPVTFTPGATLSSGALGIPVTVNGQPVTFSVALAGNYTISSAGIAFNPPQGTFGPVPTSTSGPTLLYTLNNLTARTFNLATNYPRNYVPAGAPCTTLAPNASCTFATTFEPLTSGSLPGSFVVQATPTDGTPTRTAIAYGEGYGLGQGDLTLSGGLIQNGVFSFGQIASGQSGAQVFTVANLNPAGSPAITVRRITSMPPFLSTTTCGAALAVGQSCTVTVTYTPTNQVATGTTSPTSTNDTGLLTIESDAASSPQSLNLTGLGGAVASPNPQNTTPLATYILSNSALAFAQVDVGDQTPAQTVTLTNTGTVTLHVLAITAPGDFTVSSTCTAVLPGATCTLSVSSTPKTSGTKLGALAIASDSSVSLEYISVAGIAAASPLTISPASLNFGSVQVGFTGVLAAQVTNTSTQPVTFTSITGTTDYTAGGTCQTLAASGSALAPNGACTLQVTFAPTAAAAFNGTLAIASSASTLPLEIPLSGTGIQAHLTITPSALAFGSIVLGNPANLSLTLQNTGTAPVVNLTLTATGDYGVTIPCAATTLTPGSSCIAQVTFTPSTLGPRPGTLTVTSSDPSSPVAIPLTGTGVQPGGFTFLVDGGTAANVTVVSGQPAAYTLSLIPTGGFTGAVALTCTPVVPAPYASCSLSPSTITLTASPVNGVATINTITSTPGTAALAPGPLPNALQPLTRLLLCVLFPGLLTVWRARRSVHERLPVLFALFLTTLTLMIMGCGSKSNPDPNLRYTPAGAYQYQVTASSTSGNPISQTVTLNLNVTAR